MEQKGSKGKFRFVDTVALIALLVVLLVALYVVVLLIFGGFERFRRIGRDDREREEISFTLAVRELDVELYELALFDDGTVECSFLEVGESIYLSGREIGKITSVEYEDFLRSTELADEYGYLSYLVDKSKVNLLITVEAEASVSDDGYRIGDADLSAGDDFVLSTKNFEMTALIRDVSLSAVGTTEE